MYVKIHKKTGLRYFGQTKHDPYIYIGSGVDWRRHLVEHGTDMDTVIVLTTTDIIERNHWGRYYSKLWRITTAMDDYGNRIWANRIPETGGGGGQLIMSAESVRKRTITQTGTKKPASHRAKCSANMIAENKKPNSKYKTKEVRLKKSKSMINHRKDKNSSSKFNTPEYHEKIKKSCKEGCKKYRLHYVIVDPNGIKYDVIGLVDFCKEHNLNKGAMGAVTRGELSHYKRWTGYKVEDK